MLGKLFSYIAYWFFDPEKVFGPETSYVNVSKTTPVQPVVKIVEDLEKKKYFAGEHFCHFDCCGYSNHYGQYTKITSSIENTDWFHYPPVLEQRQWLQLGFEYALVFRSHWKCPCGKTKTFFFLANPTRWTKSYLTIYDKEIKDETFYKMVKYNPFFLKSNCSKTLDELVKELNA